MEWVFRADAPIYAQLVEQLTAAIAAGVYAPGERLPTVRELAVEAGVNPNTVQRALSELERGGLVYSQRTAGRFVTDDAQRVAVEREFLARQKAEAFFADMERLGYDRVQAFLFLEQIWKEEEP